MMKSLRKIGRGAGLLDLGDALQVAFEELLVGDHADAACPELGVGLGQLHRVPGLGDEALAGAGALDLGDEGHAVLAPQRGLEVAGGGRRDQGRQNLVQRHGLLGRLDLFFLVADDAS